MKDKDGSSKKRKKSEAAPVGDAAPEAAHAGPRVRFQEEERPAKRRFAAPEGFAPVEEPCAIDADAVAEGREELWLIQLPSAKALQALAAAGSLEVDLRAGSSAVASWKDRDGASMTLLQEAGDVARQLVAVCPTGAAGGAAKAAPVTRRLTLVRAVGGPAVAAAGVVAGMAEDEAKALSLLDASLAAMDAAARESVATVLAEAGPAAVSVLAGFGAGGQTPAGAPGAGDKEKRREKKDKEGKEGRKKDKDKSGKTPAATPATTPGPAPAAAAAVTPAAAANGAGAGAGKSEKKHKKDRSEKKEHSEKKKEKKEKKDKKEKKKDKKAESGSESD
ncbi:hypothetical protein HYH03_007710 [Edaphochlamys debaryana]|uniref:Uncharacterized protein n=1 Tax=Edaphochlamys debaryana TaxID=47281 RepID=A0A836BZL1_9CHLO|nr:hypothetical protein HYH03_007710 [Edaphochlamys debaryana]|eukprot:KAG2494067.1 hypothetical protein HYH03_007710 [Edaphochlamys debaryana]